MKIEATLRHFVLHTLRIITAGEDNGNGWRKGRYGKEGEKEDEEMGKRMGW